MPCENKLLTRKFKLITYESKLLTCELRLLTRKSEGLTCKSKLQNRDSRRESLTCEGLFHSFPLQNRVFPVGRRGLRVRRLFFRLLRLRRLFLRGLPRSHVGEENHVAYGAAVRQEHRQAVNADADARRRGHAVG